MDISKLLHMNHIQPPIGSDSTGVYGTLLSIFLWAAAGAAGGGTLSKIILILSGIAAVSTMAANVINIIKKVKEK